VVLGLAAGSLLVECGARARYGVPLRERMPILAIEAHPTRGFAMVPEQEHYTYLHRARTNTLGLRGEELAPRSSERVRVLLLGDSLIYGQGVADADTVPRLLEDAAGEQGRALEAVNGGVRAYATHQELALLEELGPTIDPDLVVVCWYWNDIEERDVAATHTRLLASGPVPFDTGAPMRGRVWWRWRVLQVLRASALLMEFHDRLKARDAMPPDAAAVDAAFVRLGGYLDRLAIWCEERGATLALAVMPEAQLATGATHPAAVLQNRALELARSKGIPALDLGPAIHAATARLGRLPVLAYDGHYDPAGNRALAYGLYEFLEASPGLLPRPAK